MNNKGQTLVLFILLLPLLLIVMMLVLETGLLLVEKNKIDGEIKYAIKYALKLDTIDEDKVNNILINNLGDDIKTSIKISTSDIRIEVDKDYKFLFLKKEYKINSSYHGYISDDIIKIERE